VSLPRKSDYGTTFDIFREGKIKKGNSSISKGKFTPTHPLPLEGKGVGRG